GGSLYRPAEPGLLTCSWRRGRDRCGLRGHRARLPPLPWPRSTGARGLPGRDGAASDRPVTIGGTGAFGVVWRRARAPGSHRAVMSERTVLEPQVQEVPVGLADARPRRDAQHRHDLVPVEIRTDCVELLPRA